MTDIQAIVTEQGVGTRVKLPEGVNVPEHERDYAVEAIMREHGAKIRRMDAGQVAGKAEFRGNTFFEFYLFDEPENNRASSIDEFVGVEG